MCLEPVLSCFAFSTARNSIAWYFGSLFLCTYGALRNGSSVTRLSPTATKWLFCLLTRSCKANYPSILAVVWLNSSLKVGGFALIVHPSAKQFAEFKIIFRWHLLQRHSKPLNHITRAADSDCNIRFAASELTGVVMISRREIEKADCLIRVY